MEAVLDVLPAGTVVYADANAAWTAHDARQFVRAPRHLDYVLEQPCADHDANVTVRAVCDRPFVLDESIDSLASLLRPIGRADRRRHVEDRPSRRRGAARLVRDVAVELGLRVTVEDTGGAQVDTAAIAHLSLSTPASARTHTVDFHHWVTVSSGTGDLTCHDGRMTRRPAPGSASRSTSTPRRAAIHGAHDRDPHARRGARRRHAHVAGVGRLAAADRRHRAEHPRRRGRRHPHRRPVVPADLLRSRGLRQGRGRRRPDRGPPAPGDRGRRRRQRVLPSGVRSRARAARRRRPHVRRRRAGDHPLVLGRRARVVRRATRRATTRRPDVRQLVVAHGAGRRRPPVLRHESDRLGGAAARRPPVVADFSSSAVAWVRVNAAAQAGERSRSAGRSTPTVGRPPMPRRRSPVRWCRPPITRARHWRCSSM